MISTMPLNSPCPPEFCTPCPNLDHLESPAYPNDLLEYIGYTVGEYNQCKRRFSALIQQRGGGNDK